MKRLLKYLVSVFTILIILFLSYINIKIHFRPAIREMEGQPVNYDLLCQLRGLQDALNNNADEKMQQLYPEGFVFFNALYGLSWCEFIRTLQPASELYQEGHAEIQRAFNNIDSEQGKKIFDESLLLPYGSFYTGWSTYLLGKKLAVEPVFARNQEEVQEFEEQCRKIASAIQTHPYPESYSRQAWPADAIVCVASLALHDRLLDPVYKETVNQWLGKVKQNLGPLGLIPHSVHAGSGRSAQASRGSSQSLMLTFLAEIDRAFARDQFTIYKERFLAYRFGLPAIREYPLGKTGNGDVDSGPVILELGAAATIVGLRTMNTFGETAIGIAIRNGIEAFGLPVTNHTRKRYLFGMLPMADAFITWGHSSESTATISEQKASFFTFHLYSACIALVLVILVWWLWKNP